MSAARAEQIIVLEQRGARVVNAGVSRENELRHLPAGMLAEGMRGIAFGGPLPTLNDANTPAKVRRKRINGPKKAPPQNLLWRDNSFRRVGYAQDFS